VKIKVTVCWYENYKQWVSYHVNIPIVATSICLDFTEIFDYYPLDLHNRISNGNAFVMLKYHVISNPPLNKIVT
jgi:hypothetical protein